MICIEEGQKRISASRCPFRLCFPLDMQGILSVLKNGRGKAIREGIVTIQEDTKQEIELQYGRTVAKILDGNTTKCGVNFGVVLLLGN